MPAPFNRSVLDADLPFLRQQLAQEHFCGDVRRAAVATLGWNPSKREFLDGGGNELVGSERRLETLGSIGEENLATASPRAMARVFEGCNNYFQRRPLQLV
jgi:hypothetical protein